MTGSSIDDFRTIHVSLTDVNQFIPPIIASAGDSSGRRLAVTLSSNGRPVALADLTAQLLYNPQDGTFGDMVSMSKSGDTFYADIPAGALTGKDIARMAIAVSDSEHTVVTREFEIMVERGALNTAGEDGGAGLLQTALDRASTQAERAEFAASNANGSAQAAESGANAAKYQAEQAAAAAKSAAESKQAAATSESNARIAYEQSINLSEQSTKSAKAAKQSEDNAKQSEDAAVKAAQSVQSAQEKIATIQQEVDNKINNFTVTANAESVQSDEAASVKVTSDGAAYNLAFNIPQGAKGEKGEKGDTETAINSVSAVYDNTGATTPTVSVDAQGTPNARDLVFHFDGLKVANGRDGSRIFFAYYGDVRNQDRNTYSILASQLLLSDSEKEHVKGLVQGGDFVLGVGSEGYIIIYRVVSVYTRYELDDFVLLEIVAETTAADSLSKTVFERSDKTGAALTPISDSLGILTINEHLVNNADGGMTYTVPKTIGSWRIENMAYDYASGTYTQDRDVDNPIPVTFKPNANSGDITVTISDGYSFGVLRGLMHVAIRKN